MSWAYNIGRFWTWLWSIISLDFALVVLLSLLEMCNVRFTTTHVAMDMSIWPELSAPGSHVESWLIVTLVQVKQGLWKMMTLPDSVVDKQTWHLRSWIPYFAVDPWLGNHVNMFLEMSLVFKRCCAAWMSTLANIQPLGISADRNWAIWVLNYQHLALGGMLI
jgi:hypothetical protein